MYRNLEDYALVVATQIESTLETEELTTDEVDALTSMRNEALTVATV